MNHSTCSAERLRSVKSGSIWAMRMSSSFSAPSPSHFCCIYRGDKAPSRTASINDLLSRVRQGALITLPNAADAVRAPLRDSANRMPARDQSREQSRSAARCQALGRPRVGTTRDRDRPPFGVTALMRHTRPGSGKREQDPPLVALGWQFMVRCLVFALRPLLVQRVFAGAARVSSNRNTSTRQQWPPRLAPRNLRASSRPNQRSVRLGKQSSPS